MTKHCELANEYGWQVTRRHIFYAISPIFAPHTIYTTCVVLADMGRRSVWAYCAFDAAYTHFKVGNLASPLRSAANTTMLLSHYIFQLTGRRDAASRRLAKRRRCPSTAPSELSIHLSAMCCAVWAHIRPSNIGHTNHINLEGQHCVALVPYSGADAQRVFVCVWVFNSALYFHYRIYVCVNNKLCACVAARNTIFDRLFPNKHLSLSFPIVSSVTSLYNRRTSGHNDYSRRALKWLQSATNAISSSEFVTHDSVDFLQHDPNSESDESTKHKYRTRNNVMYILSMVFVREQNVVLNAINGSNPKREHDNA